MAESEDRNENAEETPAAEAEAPAEDAPPAEGAEGAEVDAPEAAPAREPGPPPKPPRSAEERDRERRERRALTAAARRRWRTRERAKNAGRREAEPAAAAVAEPAEGKTGAARIRQGIVVSDKADKTLTVRIDVTRSHRMYKKVIRESSTIHVHDERNDARAGDTVRVVESRPLSKTKRWRLVEVTERAR